MRLFPVSQRRIPIKIINHMDNVIEMGRNDYKLEFYDESSQTWENVLPESHAYLMITDVVPPRDTLELTIYEYTGRAGKYRVTKNGHGNIMVSVTNLVIIIYFRVSSVWVMKRIVSLMI